MKTEVNEYQKQAINFLNKFKCEIEIKYLKHGKHFEDDKENRDIYKITLKRGSRSYTFNFGQSLVNSQKYISKQGNYEFTTIGSPLKGNMRALTKKYLETYCKLVKGTAPSEYDILACLTKYDPGTFENFCADFEYDEDSRKAERIYKAVKDEFTNLCALFNDDEMSELAEIQ